MAGAAGILSVAPRTSHANETAVVPGAIPVELGKEFQLYRQSAPVLASGRELHLISLGKGTLELDPSGRMTAKVKAAVKQYAEVDYWLSLAAFDAEGLLLGAATHKEAIRYIRLGVMPTLLPELEFDFGISKSFTKVAWLSAAISDRDVPMPG